MMIIYEKLYFFDKYCMLLLDIFIIDNKVNFKFILIFYIKNRNWFCVNYLYLEKLYLK